jgi:hypothetical protein
MIPADQRKVILCLLILGEIDGLPDVLDTLACPFVAGLVGRRRTRGLVMPPFSSSARKTYIILL